MMDAETHKLDPGLLILLKPSALGKQSKAVGGLLVIA
jgi:hypothetical protein